MAKKQKTLKDVEHAIELASDIINEVCRRSLYEEPPELSFEQKIIHAVIQMENGDPLKDFLEYHEVEQAIKILSDIYTVTGVSLPEDQY